MSAADRLEDGYPHGTVQGYRDGCRGVCPAGTEHGLSCRKAATLSAGDYQYQKLVRRGATPAEIADALGLNPDTTAPTPKPGRAPAATPKPAQPLAERAHDTAPQEDAGTPAIETEAPTAPSEPAAEVEAMGHPTTPTQQESTMPSKPAPDHPYYPVFLRLHGEGLSDSAIAKQIGVAQSTVSRWRREAQLPTNGRKFGPPPATKTVPPTEPGNDYTDMLEPVHDRLNRDDAFEGAVQAAVDKAPPLPRPPRGGVTNAPIVSIGDGEPEKLTPLDTTPDALAEEVEAIPDTGPWPEWGDVAISVDVEHARNTAARLWDELTRTEAALELVLRKWAEERARRITLEDDAERTLRQLTSELDTMTVYAQGLEANFDAYRRLVHRSIDADTTRAADLVTALEDAPRSPWWERLLGK